MKRTAIPTLAMSAAAALLLAAPASATTITFESQARTANESGTTLSEAGYNMLFIEGPSAASIGQISGVGTISNNNDPGSCEITGCPTGADGNFLAVLNDGAVRFSLAAMGGGFRLQNFSLAYISPLPAEDAGYGLLQLSGVRFDRSSVMRTISFPGPDSNGFLTFGAAEIGQEFSSQVLSSLTINACQFDAAGSCVNSLDQPAFNQAQFALDNLSFNDVPEPGTLVLAGLGLGLLGLSRHRRATPSAATL